MGVLLQTSNLSKIFRVGDEEIHALKNVSLSVKQGEFLAIKGSSGSGKSTLMYILGLLDVPSSGQYLLKEQVTSNMRDDQRAEMRNRYIGFVFQSFHLLPRANAERNVALPLVYSSSFGVKLSPHEIQQRSQEALQRVGLSERRLHKPNELSGGQRQRVAIARAIVNRPKLLFADEPTGNLDSQKGSEILNIFEGLHQDGVTIILVTHDPMVASHANRIIELKDGEVISDTVRGN